MREFLVEFMHEEPPSQAVLLHDAPPPTGSQRWDAFVAALAEHLAFHHRLPCPGWTQEPQRSLSSAWFLSTLPAARAAAMETSPASFRRRLIFLNRADLRRGMSERLLDRQTLEAVFERLALELEKAEVRADLYVFGGAEMILAYGVDRATRAVDAVFEPHGAVLEAARRVAAREGLPAWWLNEQAAVYLSPQDDADRSPVFDHPHLRVAAASGEHMVAMKALAARAQDLEDLRALVAHLGLRSAEDVFDVVARVFPDVVLPPRKRLLIQDALS